MLLEERQNRLRKLIDKAKRSRQALHNAREELKLEEKRHENDIWGNEQEREQHREMIRKWREELDSVRA